MLRQCNITRRLIKLALSGRSCLSGYVSSCFGINGDVFSAVSAALDSTAAVTSLSLTLFLIWLELILSGFSLLFCAAWQIVDYNNLKQDVYHPTMHGTLKSLIYCLFGFIQRSIGSLNKVLIICAPSGIAGLSKFSRKSADYSNGRQIPNRKDISLNIITTGRMRLIKWTTYVVSLMQSRGQLEMLKNGLVEGSNQTCNTQTVLSHPDQIGYSFIEIGCAGSYRQKNCVLWACWFEICGMCV